jgi:hypothetical protein
MQNIILLNDEAYKVSEKDLPYLVTYKDKSGGSHFSITLLRDLYLSGSKILFFTAYPMAKDNFLEQIGADHSRIALVSKVPDFEINKDKQVIILESGDEALLVEALKLLTDINERVVLIKNIEAFSARVFDACLPLNKIILSGNLDSCVAKEKILNKFFQSIVVFTKPEISLPIEIPQLEKWTGYLSNPNQNGTIKVQIN